MYFSAFYITLILLTFNKSVYLLSISLAYAVIVFKKNGKTFSLSKGLIYEAREAIAAIASHAVWLVYGTLKFQGII